MPVLFAAQARTFPQGSMIDESPYDSHDDDGLPHCAAANT